MNITVGKCSVCGGRVTTSREWMGVNEQEPRCESCNRLADTLRGLPSIPMKESPKKEATA